MTRERMWNMTTTPRRSIRIPDTLWKTARAEAAERGETVTDAITRFLTRYISKTD